METGSPPKRRRLIKSPQRPSPLRRPLHCIAEQQSKATRSSDAKTDEKSKRKPPPNSRAKNPSSTKSKDAKPVKTKSLPHPEPETSSSSKAQIEIPLQNPSNQNETCSQNQNEPAQQNEPAESPQAPETKSQAPPTAESKITKTPVPEVCQLCEEHLSCPPVPWTVMGEKLKHVRRAINGLCPLVTKFDNVEGFHWAEGESMITNLLAIPKMWEEEGCSVCAGLEFIYSWAGLPFMVGLCILGEFEFFDLCLEAVRLMWGVDGDSSVENVTQWIQGVLASWVHMVSVPQLVESKSI